MADHVEDLETRVSVLETRVDREMTAVQEHFAELRQFITFSLDRQATRLRTEWREDLKRIEYRLDVVDHRFDRMDERFASLENKVDAHHAATQTALREILSRLPKSE